MIAIVLVDDHRLVGRSLKAYLESFPEFRVVGIASSGEELLDRLDEWKPRIVLQDLLLPGGIDGIETIRRVAERAPSVKTIALTAPPTKRAWRCARASGRRRMPIPRSWLAATCAVAKGRTTSIRPGCPDRACTVARTT
jgi:DNA-binding NarL/FixJ family response regulator